MQADKAKNIRLLKTARGQLDGIIRMMEDDRYCIDISNQLMSTQAILKKTNQNVLRAHLENCVVNALSGDDADEAGTKIREIMEVIEKISGK
ncbi:MAG: metal-sensing transcriptional repressor [Fastidiosipilaceae bacterium]|jgi:DNA-binding FrmR family transcriptional regulator